jgi:hypothetical protein
MKFSKLKHVACLSVILSSVLGCTPHREQAGSQGSDAAAASGRQFDVLLAHCFAPQGNGGNWASTLGWMSEEIHLRIVEAEALQKSGRSVGIHLGCMVGGSSGSVAAATLSAVLENKNLLPGRTAQSPLSIAEATKAMRAIRFVAQAADLNPGELARFYIQVLLGEGQKKVHDAVDKVVPSNSKEWWTGSTVDPKRMLVDFAGSVRLAATLTPEILDKGIGAALKGSQLEGYTKHSVKLATELPNFPALNLVPDAQSSEGKILAAGFEEQSKFLKTSGDNFLRSQFGIGEYASRYLSDLSAKGGASKLKQTLDAQFGDGICTISMALIARSEQDTREIPDYKKLSPTVFCNEATIVKIVSSSLYQKHIKENHPYASRFVLAAVPTLRGGIVPSIREPNMMVPLKSPLGSGELEVRRFYNPKWDKDVNGKLTFGLMDAKKVRIGSQDIVPHVGVAGGFPDRRIAAWIGSYYLMDNIQGRLSKLAGEVKVTFGLFGRDNKRNNPAFHKIAVKDVFSSSPDIGARNLQDWLGFADSWCDTMGGAMQSKYKAKIGNVTLNWEVSKVPAAQKPGGASNQLVVKSINATRTQVGKHLKGIGAVFDPEVGSDHVPHLVSPNGCKEN